MEEGELNRHVWAAVWPNNGRPNGTRHSACGPAAAKPARVAAAAAKHAPLPFPFSPKRGAPLSCGRPVHCKLCSVLYGGKQRRPRATLIIDDDT